VGLKDYTTFDFFLQQSGSNRTIVGLKAISALSLKLGLTPAAIAPLWD